ncbi:unnamed protein product [Protopolystoma xenopodis]|uniref:Uncharacterized protein n=1 Tax=Protopolystoma xenopodis TaxID=117903 RepID=A0A3S5CHE5_9PLAT|nr:unnamed protein product [Protopolystoma xenopodis]
MRYMNIFGLPCSLHLPCDPKALVAMWLGGLRVETLHCNVVVRVPPWVLMRRRPVAAKSKLPPTPVGMRIPCRVGKRNLDCLYNTKRLPSTGPRIEAPKRRKKRNK